MRTLLIGGWLACLVARAALAAPPADACRLLTGAEIAAVQAGSLVETKPTIREAGGYSISDCFYRMEPFASSVSLEIVRRAPGAGGRDPAEHWERIFRAEPGEGETDERERGAGERREAGEMRELEREKTPPLAVAGVGDEAFWIANRASGVLYARRGHAYVRISVGGSGSDEEKRGRAAQLARKALRRL